MVNERLVHMKSYELKIAVTDEEDKTLRENLIQVLGRDRPYSVIIITLRSGKQFHFPFGVEKLDQMTEEEIRKNEEFMRRCATNEWVIVGKNYIEIDRAPGSSLPFFEMVPLSEIVSVYYY
jgi:hypothetical protein